MFGVVDVHGKEECPEICGEVPEVDPGLHECSTDGRREIMAKMGVVVSVIDVLRFIVGQPVYGSCNHTLEDRHRNL